MTVLGQTQSENDYSQNQVVISNTGTALTILSEVALVIFQNVNFVNTAPGYGVAIIKGNKNGFYQCQFISAGSLGITTDLGLGLIANSHIEVREKVIDGTATFYVFNTVIFAIANSALIL